MSSQAREDPANVSSARLWWSLSHTLSTDRLAELLDLSEDEVRQYFLAPQDTPDTIRAKLVALAYVTRELSGTYLQKGIRSWFSRPRAQLDGRTPRDLLKEQGDWSVDTPIVQDLIALAGASRTMIAT